MTPTRRPDEAGGRDRILAIADSLVDERDATVEETEKPEGWICFAVGGGVYALPVSHVRGVHRAGQITPLPQAPAAVRGLTNLRGRVIAVVDLAVQLGLDETELDAASRILDAEFGHRRLGILTDRTESLLKVRSLDIEPLGDEVEPTVARRAAGVVATKTGRVVLLDPDQILEDAGGSPTATEPMREES